MRPKALLALLSLLALGVAASGCFDSTSTNLTVTQAVTLGTGTSETVVQPGSASGTTTAAAAAATTGGGDDDRRRHDHRRRCRRARRADPRRGRAAVLGLPHARGRRLEGQRRPEPEPGEARLRLIVNYVTNGAGGGAMPSFKSQFNAAQIKCIAAYVSTAASATGAVTTDMKGKGAPASIADACKGIKLSGS